MRMKTLYKKHATGKIGTWNISHMANTIHMETCVNYRAKPIRHNEIVTIGKQGRSIKQQVQARIESRIKTKLDSGYKLTETEAKADTHTNAAGLPRPMLASRELKGLNEANIYVQPKLDGMRLIATRQNNEIIMYSRNGKSINIPHIAKALKSVIHEGEFLDGELYNHDMPLNRIMSLVKQYQPDTKLLSYHVFDMISEEPFYQRLKNIETKNIETVETIPLAGRNIDNLMAVARRRGYEGLILRDGDAPYEVGKRSKALVKVKEFFDEEYTVVDVTLSDKGVPVLVCLTDAKTFRVTAPGNAPEKEWAYKNPGVFIGSEVTVRHVGFTPYGVPFHPVCLGLRK